MDRTELPPSPFERRPRFGRWRFAVAAAVLVMLTLAAYNLPIPVFYTYLPGPVRDVEGLVEVEGARTYSSEGALYLTTVSVDTRVTFAELVAAALDPTRAVVRREDVTGGSSLRELQEAQRAQMRESKRHALEVVFAALGLGKPLGDGAKVEDTVRGSPAHGELRQGDVIVRVDGERVDTSCDVIRLVDRREPGDRVELLVRRRGRQLPIELSTVENPQQPGTPLIGVILTDLNYRFDPGITVRFKTGNIAGPSAGLMFALALYDRLTPGDLTAGRRIAGTGEINCGGDVGAIGGVEQKVAGAEAEGAEIFLAPVANFEAARAAAGDIEVVAVATFQDALDYLEGLQG
jgi:PDZ domain-containing protein